MSNGPSTIHCDHEACMCTAGPQTSVIVGDAIYCSLGCAEGRGCSHDACNCGTTTEA